MIARITARPILYFAFGGLILANLLLPAFDVRGQSYRYMDEAGNMYFVDSLQEVPQKYRYQVVAPRPSPVGTPLKIRPTPRPSPTKAPKKEMSEKERLKIYLQYKKSLRKKMVRAEDKAGLRSMITPHTTPGVTPTPLPTLTPTPISRAKDLLKELEAR